MSARAPTLPLSRSPTLKLARRAWRQKGSVVGAAVITLVVLLAVLAPFVAPANPYVGRTLDRLLPPLWLDGRPEFWLGTDQLGRDLWARLVYGGRVSLLVGVLAVLAREEWRVGLPLTLFALLALAILNRIRGLAVPQNRAERAASADLFGYLEERLGGLPDLKTSGADAHALRRLDQRLTARFRRAEDSAMAGSLFQGGVGLLFALGLGAALGLTRVLSALLFGVHPMDQLSYAAVSAVLGSVALLATYLAARRATRVDPMIAMRADV